MGIMEWLGIGGLVVGVLAIIGAYVWYRKGQRRKEPCWAIRSNNIVTGYTARVGGLEILYGGEKLESLTISRILFWNRGGETIHHGDIAPGDPLRVTVVGEVKLLDLTLLQVNSEPSEFSAAVEPDRKSALLGFEYLDPGQGAVLQAVHSGTSSKDVQVRGSIKGVGKPAKRKIRPRRTGLFTVLGLAQVLFLAVFLGWIGFTGDEQVSWWGWALLGFVLGVAVLGIVILLTLYFSATNPPRGLETFQEEI